MQQEPSPIQSFRAARQKTDFDCVANLRAVLARANGNLSRNTYITSDPVWSIGEAERQLERSSEAAPPPLLGVPVSLKDIFDLQGFRTSIGSKFYAAHNPEAAQDSALVARLKRAGAIITGKTHLQQLAYGITGENGDYGNCLQPANATRLTGGSSSGAAASIQEGSALAAIGTDTGGSIRVPAALCGLAGYRSSYGVGDWRGGAHLAHSFDTIGWLFRDLRDAALLAESVFDLPPAPDGDLRTAEAASVGVLSGAMLEDCDPEVKHSLEVWKDRLTRQGAKVESIDPQFWSEAWEIYVPIQAFEAAKLHAGFFHEFEPAITARLEMGATIREEEISLLRERNRSFAGKMDEVFRRFDFLLTPATPVSCLDAAQDHSNARPRILRFTLPASLSGLPAVVLPSPECGLQLLASHNDDRRLLRFATQLGEHPAQ